jgi:hypothetical protein
MLQPLKLKPKSRSTILPHSHQGSVRTTVIPRHLKMSPGKIGAVIALTTMGFMEEEAALQTPIRILLCVLETETETEAAVDALIGARDLYQRGQSAQISGN